MLSSKVLKRVDQIIEENPEAFEALLEYEKTGRLPKIEELKKEKLKIKIS